MLRELLLSWFIFAIIGVVFKITANIAKDYKGYYPWYVFALLIIYALSFVVALVETFRFIIHL